MINKIFDYAIFVELLEVKYSYVHVLLAFNSDYVLLFLDDKNKKINC